jgi:hypothetical protein
MWKPRRIDLLCVLLLAVLLSSIYYLTLRPDQNWGGDFSQYINHARNIALGKPYLDTRFVVTLPEAAVHMPPSYPPIFPLLLAPFYARYGLNYTALKVVPESMFVLSVIALYALARVRGVAPPGALIAAIGLGLSGIVLDLKDSVVSDGTYLCFATFTLVALLYIEKNRWDESRPALAAAAVTVLMLLAYGSRAIGLSLITAFVLYEAVWKRRIRLYNVLVVAGFAVGLLLILRVYDTRTYSNQFVFAPATYLHNAILYIRAPVVLWAGSPALVRHGLFALTLVFAAANWVRRVIQSGSVVECYIVTTVLPVILYSAGHSERYLLPIFPIYILYFVESVIYVGVRFLGRSKYAVAAAALLLAVGAVTNLRGMEKGPYRAGVGQATFQQLCDFLRTRTNGRLLVSWNPRVLALYTNLRSAWYPFVDQDEAFDAYLERVHAGYLLVYMGCDDDRQWLLPHIERQSSRFPLLFQNTDFSVYEVNQSGSLQPR